MRDMFLVWIALAIFLARHCTYSMAFLQIALTVKECDPLRLPFADCDLGRSNEFQYVWTRFEETAFNAPNRVLHEFSCSVPEVRRGLHKPAESSDIIRKPVIQSAKKARVRIKMPR